MFGKLFICGLFEQELVKKGIMKPGRCRDCIHYEGFREKDELFVICGKDGKRKRLKEEKTNCKDWVIDTR